MRSMHSTARQAFAMRPRTCVGHPALLYDSCWAVANLAAGSSGFQSHLMAAACTNLRYDVLMHFFAVDVFSYQLKVLDTI